MIDADGKFWALEVNQTPTMFGDKVLRDAMQNMLREAIDIVMEIRELRLKGCVVDQHTPLKRPQMFRRALLDYRRTPLQIVDALIQRIDFAMR